MHSASNYSKAIFPFPKDDIDPQEKKQAPWILEAAKAVFSRYVGDRGVIRYNDIEKFDTLRKYSDGNQDKEQYKENWKATEDAGDRRAKGFVNMDWDIFSPAPKFMALIRKKMSNLQSEPEVMAIDEMSGAEREEKKFDAWFHSVFADLIEEVESRTGVRQKRPDFIPSSMEELEIFSEINGFKVKSEIAYNRGLKYTDAVSNFKDIQRKLQDDLITLNACIIKDYVDWEDGVVKLKYIDPARFIGHYSVNHNFDKSRYFGHIEDYTIAELRQAMPHIPEEEFQTLAKNHCGYAQNPASGDWDKYNRQYDNGIWAYDDFIIPVLEGEYLTVDTKYRTKITSKRYGTVRYVDDEFGKMRDSETKQTVLRPVKNWYRFKWVIGSDYVFDYGLQYDIPRPKLSKPRPSYHCYKIPGKSFIERIKPHLNAIQEAWLKLQAAWAAAAPDGLAVEWGALENITMGDKEKTPMELLRIRQQTGMLLYRATTTRGNINISQAKPVQELQGGLGKMAVDAIQTIEFYLNIIADATGLNRFSAGQTPSPETSATASQISEMGTEDVISDLAHGFNMVRESAALNTCLRMALRVKYSKEAYNIYHASLGYNTGILKITADMTPSQMGIYMKVKPNRDAIQRITQAAQLALQGTAENPPIGLDDYLKIERAIEAGNLTFAEAMLSYKQRKAKEEAMQMQQANIDRQNQGLAAIEQQKAQAAQAKLMGEIEKEKVKIQMNKEAQIEIDNNQHKNKMAEIELEKGMEAQVEMQQNSMNQANAENIV